jgi:hypothetical protein
MMPDFLPVVNLCSLEPITQSKTLNYCTKLGWYILHLLVKKDSILICTRIRSIYCINRFISGIDSNWQ